MNKRIKKKKAKQARQQELEQLEQELAKLSPEQLEDVMAVIKQAFSEIAKAISYVFNGLVEVIKKMEVELEGIEQQRALQLRPRTVQVQKYRKGYLGKKGRADVQQWRGHCRKSGRRYQQTDRKHRHQTKHRCPTKKP